MATKNTSWDSSPSNYTMTVPEAARHLSVSPNTVRKFVKSGELAASRIGTRVMIKSEHLDRFLEDTRA